MGMGDAIASETAGTFNILRKSCLLLLIGMIAVDAAEMYIVDHDEDTSFIERQFPKVEQDGTDQELICEGKVQLRNVRCPLDACSGEACTSCKLEFNAKIDCGDPEECPTEESLFDNPLALGKTIVMDVDEAHNLIQSCDEAEDSDFRSLPLSLMGFSQSTIDALRAMSTPLAVADPTVKVIAKPNSLTKVSTMCDSKKAQNFGVDCNKAAVVDLIGKVWNIINREPKSSEKTSAVILFDEDVTLSIQTVLAAFPDIPYVFLYQPPELNEMSDYPIKLKRRKCSKLCNNPTEAMIEMLQRHGKSPENVSKEDCCAANEALKLEAAEAALALHDNGYLVNILDLPSALITIYEEVFGKTFSEKQLTKMSHVANKDKIGGTFLQLSKNKAENFTPKMKESSELFVDGPYEHLSLHGGNVADEGRRKLYKRLADWSGVEL